TIAQEHRRKSAAVMAAIFGSNHPLMYPRNRFGKGYVIDNRRDSIQGRELPNLERPNDLLTPERIVLAHPMQWPHQPLPAGFDFVDPLTFPRSAMLGMPPTCTEEWNRFPEVTRRLLPEDFCRGNIFGTSPEDLSSLFHPDGSRCASLGLRLPFFRGDEEVVLEGMDPRRPRLRIRIPDERPVFTCRRIPSPGATIDADLHLLQVIVPRKLLCLVWVGRTDLSRPLLPGEDREISAAVQIRMRRA